MKDKRIAILFLTIFIDLLGFGVVIPILPNLAKELALDSQLSVNGDIAVGIVAAAFSLIQFLFAPIFGSISDRIGRRPIILGSVIVNAMGYVLFAFSGSFWLLLIARIVSGFGSANISAAQAYIADITEPQDRAKKMGIIGAAFGLGFVFGPPIGGKLYDIGGPIQGLMLVGGFTAILCLLNFVLAYFLLPESLVNKTVEKRKASDTFKGMVSAWSIEIIGELLLIGFVYVAAFSMMQINASILWKEKYHLNPAEIGNIFGIIGIFSAIVQGGLIGLFQNKIGLKKMLIWGCPIAAIGLTLIPLPSVEWFYPVQIVAILFLALGNGFLMPSINSLISINTPAESQGKMLGIFQSISSLARVIGPVLSGFLYVITPGLPYYTGGVFMLMAFVLALVLSNKLTEVK